MILFAAMLAAIAAEPSAAAPPSLQQAFDTATTALIERRFDEAERSYGELEGRARIPQGTLAVIRARHARALLGLNRMDEAAAMFRAALAILPADRKDLIEDRFIATEALAAIEEHDLDFAGARHNYAAAAAIAPLPADHVAALAGQARTTMFYDAPASIALLDTALGLMPVSDPKNKPIIGQIRAVRGRALLNAGRAQEAWTELAQATQLLGGLTARVDSADVSTRGDAALAAILSNHKNEAKKYLAYSGAGTQGEGWLGHGETPPVSCSEGLDPADVAVIEFTINDDGRIENYHPVYSSAGGDKALKFAAAAGRWSWDPEKIKTIRPLFRSFVRLEMRCSTAEKTRLTVGMISRSALEGWLADHGIEPFDTSRVSDAAAVPLLRAELARREARYGAEAPALIPILLQLGGNIATGRAESEAWFIRADRITAKSDVPPIAKLMVRSANWAITPAGRHTTPQRQMAALADLMKAPDIAADPEARNGGLLIMADMLTGLKRPTEAAAALRRIDGDAQLPPHDPIRVAALSRLASIDAAAGDLTGAQAAFMKTGLSEQQCSLSDAQPVRVKGKGSASDFPQDAVNWGISGWATVEFDIQADGTTRSPRTIMAYPPFVFGGPTEKIATRARYTQSYRPAGSAGCGGFHYTQGYTVFRR